MLKIAYMGFGKRSASFVKRFRELGLLDAKVAIVGAYDVAVTNAEAHARDVNLDMPVYDDGDRMLAETRPDAVIIGSFDSAHLENFRQVQPLNVPVMVEKPLESDLERASEFVRLARRNTAPVLVAHSMRFSPIIRRAKQMLDEGRIGKVHSFRFHNNVHYGHGYFRKWMRLKANVGSIVVEKGCHDLDILHMLMGSRTTNVFSSSKRLVFGGDRPSDLRCRDCPDVATCRDSLPNNYLNVLGDSVPWELSERRRDLCVFAREIDTNDDDVCLLRLESGAHGTYIQTLYTPYSFKSRIYTLVGTLGILEIDMDEVAGDLRIYPRYGSKKDLVREHIDYLGTNNYNSDRYVIRHFYDVITGVSEPACSVEDGYLAIAVAITAGISAEKNQPLDVPGIPEM